MTDLPPSRRTPRVKAEHTLLVAKVNGVALDQLGCTHTVGLGGCGFESDVALEEGAEIELMLAMRPAAISIAARVVYCRPVAGSWDVGVEFREPSPPARAALGRLIAARSRREAED
jgi:hypothetical protein